MILLVRHPQVTVVTAQAGTTGVLLPCKWQKTWKFTHKQGRKCEERHRVRVGSHLTVQWTSHHTGIPPMPQCRGLSPEGQGQQ